MLVFDDQSDRVCDAQCLGLNDVYSFMSRASSDWIGLKWYAILVGPAGDALTLARDLREIRVWNHCTRKHLVKALAVIRNEMWNIQEFTNHK